MNDVDFDAPWNGEWAPLGEDHELRIERASNQARNNEKEYLARWRNRGEASNGHPLSDRVGQRAFPSVAAARKAAHDCLNPGEQGASAEQKLGLTTVW
jgi:hypothetical protein